ncbi:MAG: hypothetical protein HY270_05030 [Deltaproteobacteria bacterium]|nr:hypothetical protein [Deltaproteobacteria bacterium]
MQLIARGKWLKGEKRWNMVVALRPKPEEAASTSRKPPQRSKVLPFTSQRQRTVAD